MARPVFARMPLVRLQPLAELILGVLRFARDTVLEIPSSHVRYRGSQRPRRLIQRILGKRHVLAVCTG